VKKVVFAAALVAAVLVPGASASSPPRVKLSLIPLPKAALGAAAHTLTLAHDSGVISNATAASDSISATGSSLKALGRVTGYTLDYGDPYTGKAGVTAAKTGVEKYKTAADAKRGLAFWKQDDNLIKLLTAGSTTVSLHVQPVKIKALGSARFALSDTIAVPGHPSLTLVDAQVAEGSYVVEAATASASSATAKGLALKLVAKVDQRLRLALAGRLHARPVKLLPALKAGPPKGGPDISTIALTTTDLGQATISDASYGVDKQAISDYELNMKPAGAFEDLTQEIEWYSTPDEASFLGIFGATVFTNTVAAILGGPGVTTTNTPVDVTSVGDGAQASITEFAQTGAPPIYVVIVVLTKGQATDLVVTSSESPVQSSDVVTLAQAAANHLNIAIPG